MENVVLTNVGRNANIVSIEDMDYIFSYSSNIMQLKDGKIIAVGEDWDYSTTTGKHLNMCLRELGKYELSYMTRAQKEKYFIELGLI